MKLLALDQATRTGWTVADDRGAASSLPCSEWLTGSFRAAKRPEIGEQLMIVEDSILELIDLHHPERVIYEEPYNPIRDLTGRVEVLANEIERAEGDTKLIAEALAKARGRRSSYNVETVNFLQMVKGAVTLAAARRSIPTESYTPGAWRVTVLGKGNSRAPSGAADDWSKKAVFERMKAKGFRGTNFDQADSGGLAYHALFGAPAAKRATMDLFDLTAAL